MLSLNKYNELKIRKMTKKPNSFLTDKKFPFCPGCGHGISIHALNKALQELNYGPKDVVVVSDIGCSGLIDPLFATHTIHGLHGRSPALGLGVAMALSENKNKKVIAFIGDGGATIGLQHILEAARRNIDMTLIVLNNLLYGMTGGQISGLSTQKYKAILDFEQDIPPFDLIELSHASGARFAVRVNNTKKVKDTLKKAIETEGFSIVEAASLCPSYGIKKMDELIEVIDDENILEHDRPATILKDVEKQSLIEKTPILKPNFKANLTTRKGFLIAGSAGGGAQSVAKFLAMAGIYAGLETTMKGEYPITVGTGFSVAEVIFDTKKINYTGLPNPDFILIVSIDGLNKVKSKLNTNSTILMDEKLITDELLAQYPNIISVSLTKNFNKKSLALAAVAYVLNKENIIPLSALKQAVNNHRLKNIFIEVIDKITEL
jgi:pyruvate/2-oxoacid:ferredoxin oxidoreductase beta subunit/Pyruvate/2-oxoacid:ferredoxin oxidoreductase gamma subunit